MSDDETEQLRERVVQLEQTVSKMLPGRRDVIRGAGGALAGGGAVYAATGGASGQATDDQSGGQLGEPANPQDIWLDRLYDPDGNQILDVDPSEPINAQFSKNWVFDSINGGGPVSDGDGTERQVWVIASGASDPAGADAEDIILEAQ